MKHLQQTWHKGLIAFFAACILCGSGLAYAAPMLWSYPNDHILITEVNYQGTPGPDPGAEWIELYNPTGNDILFLLMRITHAQPGGLIDIPTPTPPIPNSTPTPYLFAAGCFMYMAHDAAAFYSEYNQCPDYAYRLDMSNCPNTQRLNWSSGQINNTNETLCAQAWLLGDPSYTLIDAVGWGTGGPGSASCSPVSNPLQVPLSTPGITYLRGSDAPEWIGPGGEGEETPGAPLTEQLDEVWNLSSDVNVPWEGPEAGACRAPTAVTLQHPTAQAAQDSGIVLALFGLIGLLGLTAVWNWRYNKPTL